MKLSRFQAAEEELRDLKNELAKTQIVHQLTIHSVHFNEKKAKLLSKGIKSNQSII